MRLRNIRGKDEIAKNHPKIIVNTSDYNGDLRKAFENSNPLHIEIGSGKGLFIKTLSEKNPEINYLGFEFNAKVIQRNIIHQLKAHIPSNLFIVDASAEVLRCLLPNNSVEKIYLNFSDPWPKPRHKKRRLTSPGYLDIYKTILSQEGEIEFKTDNEELFNYSLEMLNQNKWSLFECTNDLYHSEYLDGNIQTEYEIKFVHMGKKINKLKAKPYK
jgi:tRNA (guanine-N7-)-methyltransferase